MSAAAEEMCDRLVRERQEELAPEQWSVAYFGYLSRLASTHGDNPAMVTYVERSKRLLAGREEP